MWNKAVKAKAASFDESEKIYKLFDFMVWPNRAFKAGMHVPFSWSGDKRNIKLSLISHLWFIIGFIALIYQNVGLLIFLFTLRPQSYNPDAKFFLSFRTISETGSILGLIVVASSKLWTICWYAQDIKHMMEEFEVLLTQRTMATIVPDVLQRQKNKERIEFFKNKSHKLMKYLFWFYMFGMLVYNGTSFAYFYVDFRTTDNGEWPQFRCQSETWYPWHNPHNNVTLIYNIISYICQLQASITGCSFIMGSEFMLCFFITQIQMHFDFLADDISNLDAQYGMQSCFQLKLLLLYHTRLLRLSKELNKIYEICFTVNFCTSAISLCLMGFTILSSAQQSFKYAVGLLTVLIFTLFICFNGTELTEAVIKL